MHDTLLQIENEYDLFNKTIHYAKVYFNNWEKEDFDEFQKFAMENSILYKEDDLKNLMFKPFKIGYEIRVGQENLIALSVVLDIFVKDNDLEQQVCSYYCFYDKQGNMLDDFIDC